MHRLSMKQRWVVWFCGLGVLVSLLFPPWWLEETWDNDTPQRHYGTQVFRGRARRWLFNPPGEVDLKLVVGQANNDRFTRGIAYPELAFEIAAILILGAGLLWVVRDERANLPA